MGNKKVKQSRKNKIDSTVQLFIPNLKIFSIILAVISIALYANTINHDYVLDDYSLIKENRFTKAGFDGIGDILSKDMFAGHVENYNADLAGGRYRPLSQITFAIEVELFGLNPKTGHVGNILLFSLTSIFVFLSLSQLLKDFKFYDNEWYLNVPFIAALIFAIHPIHTEAVANIKGRDEIMALLLILVSFYYFLKYYDYQKRSYLIVSVVAFFLALMSKENAITYMAVLPLSLILFREVKISESVKSVIYHFVVTALFLIIRQSIVGTAKELPIPELMNEPFYGMTFIEKYSTIFATLLYYIKLLIIPYPLTYDYYPYHVEKLSLMNFDLDTIYAILLYSAILFYAIKYYKSNKIISFSIFYYIITISIVSNLLFTIGSFMNERFVFMPSVAIGLVIAWILSYYIFNRFQNKIVVIALITTVFMAYTYITFNRNQVWKDNFTLMTTDVETSSNSAFGNFAAGGQYYIKGQKEQNQIEKQKYFNKAKKHLYKSLEIYPRYSNAALSLGNVYYTESKNADSTIKYYKLSFDVYSYNYETAINLGRLYRDSKKDFKNAEFYFKHCFKVNPNRFEAYNELGVIYFNSRNFSEAALMFENAINRNPSNKLIYKNLHAVYLALGNKEKAEEYLLRANSIR